MNHTRNLIPVNRDTPPREGALIICHVHLDPSDTLEGHFDRVCDNNWELQVTQTPAQRRLNDPTDDLEEDSCDFWPISECFTVAS